MRGSDQFSVYPGQLRNPRAAVHAFVRSGGSRGPGMSVPIDLAFLREQSTNTCLVVHARGGAAWHKGHWTVPGGGALNMVLTYAGFGRLPTAWFSQLDPDSPSIPARYRWSARLVCSLSRAAGRPIPYPRHVPLDDSSPLLRWMTAILRKGEVPLLQTFQALILLAVNLLVLFLGCFIEGPVLLLVLPPILVPALVRIGVDPVHFGIVLIVGVGIGLFTPPVGMGLYAMQGFTKTSFGEVVAAVLPWLLPLVGALLVVTYVPSIALALPRALGY